MKEPASLSRSDGRRPDGLTLIPWQGGRPLVWDVTFVATILADSYVSASAALAGAAAETAATRKSVKYADLPASYLFEPIAFETLGPMNLSALNLLNDLGRKISSVSGDNREGHFLFQRLSVILQRYNAVLLHESFIQSDGLDL